MAWHCLRFIHAYSMSIRARVSVSRIVVPLNLPLDLVWGCRVLDLERDAATYVHAQLLLLGCPRGSSSTKSSEKASLGVFDTISEIPRT